MYYYNVQKIEKIKLIAMLYLQKSMQKVEKMYIIMPGNVHKTVTLDAVQ